LSTRPAAGEPVRQLVLAAKPLVLAEKIGDCSYFEAQADWLKDLRQLTLTGSVRFKGADADRHRVAGGL